MIITEFSGILILQCPTNIDLEHRPSQEEGVCLLERCLIFIANENSSNVLHADIEIRYIYIYIHTYIIGSSRVHPTLSKWVTTLVRSGQYIVSPPSG